MGEKPAIRDRTKFLSVVRTQIVDHILRGCLDDPPDLCYTDVRGNIYVTRGTNRLESMHTDANDFIPLHCATDFAHRSMSWQVFRRNHKQAVSRRVRSLMALLCFLSGCCRSLLPLCSVLMELN